MSLSDPVSDMLTRIRNATRAALPSVQMPASKMKAAIAEVLKQNGYIEDFSVADDGPGKSLSIVLKYYDGESVIEGIERVSKPSRRQYAGADKLPRVLGGLGVAIVSTSKGVMTDRSARKENIGGEVLCHVW